MRSAPDTGILRIPTFCLEPVHPFSSDSDVSRVPLFDSTETNLIYRHLLAFIALSMTTVAYAASLSTAEQSSSAPNTQTFVRESILAERDFPLLDALLKDPAVRSLLATDTVLMRVTKARWKSVQEANRDCKDVLACKSSALRFTPEQIEEITASLIRLYQANASLRAFVNVKLVPSSVFTLKPSKTREEMFIDNWKQSAAAMNHIIATYCSGVSPRYPNVDSMTYQPGSKDFAGFVRSILDNLPIEESALPNARDQQATLFFEPTLRFSLRLLQANSRDEAGRFWPLQSGENVAPIQQLSSITWSTYPYSLILVPGEGPEVPGVALSPGGMERLRLAVEAYRTGLAPYIMVSGGFVHPSQTPFCEAIEMKRYLLEIYGIPASAILLEPYARHTTTNLRNAARQVFDYGLPSTIPMLVVSDTAQTDYIQSADFAKRNQEELGYLPGAVGKRLSANQLEVLPSRESLYRDANDPLDP